MRSSVPALPGSREHRRAPARAGTREVDDRVETCSAGAAMAATGWGVTVVDHLPERRRPTRWTGDAGVQRAAAARSSIAAGFDHGLDARRRRRARRRPSVAPSMTKAPSSSTRTAAPREAAQSLNLGAGLREQPRVDRSGWRSRPSRPRPALADLRRARRTPPDRSRPGRPAPCGRPRPRPARSPLMKRL